MNPRMSSGRRVAAETASLVLFGLGSALCTAFLSRVVGWSAVVVLTLFMMGLRGVASLPKGGHWLRRAGRGVAQAGLLSFSGFSLYFAVALGHPLAWTTSAAVRFGVGALLLAWLAGLFAKPGVPRIPLVLPLGIWIVCVQVGWLREESFIRCDDYARLSAPASLLLPTTTDVKRCRAGDVLPIGRYPRKFWQSADGRWLRFTTQGGTEIPHEPGRLAGLVCELDLKSGVSPEPRCLGGSIGKSHGFIDAEGMDKLFMAAWSLPRDSQGLHSAVFTLPAEGPMTIEAEHRFDGAVGDGLYEPKSRMLHLFCDENDRIRTVKLPGFERQPDTPVALFPGQVHYDASHDEGVVCSWLTGIAVRGNPLSYRFFAAQAPSLWSALALSWGCDWDSAARRVYAAIPNLGLLYEIDYDTAQILHRHWIGFGMRSVTFDPRRRHVYVADFLKGDVIAIDAVTGEERGRWFVGRFVRDTYLARDGNTLFASSNLGVVQIALAPAP